MGKRSTRKKATAKGNHTDIHSRERCVRPRRIALELHHDRDGRWRRRIQENGGGTAVSGATPVPAWKEAAHA